MRNPWTSFGGEPLADIQDVWLADIVGWFGSPRIPHPEFSGGRGALAITASTEPRLQYIWAQRVFNPIQGSAAIGVGMLIEMGKPGINPRRPNGWAAIGRKGGQKVLIITNLYQPDDPEADQFDYLRALAASLEAHGARIELVEPG